MAEPLNHALVPSPWGRENNADSGPIKCRHGCMCVSEMNQLRNVYVLLHREKLKIIFAISPTHGKLKYVQPVIAQSLYTRVSFLRKMLDNPHVTNSHVRHSTIRLPKWSHPTGVW